MTRQLAFESSRTRSQHRGSVLLDDITITVDLGEFVAIVGPSGAGKSTLLACMAGLQRPTRGGMSVLGTDLAGLNRRRLARLRLQHIALVLQSDNLISALTTLENVSLPLRLRRENTSSARRQIATEALRSVGMAWASDALPAALSGGERQRVALARMLATPAQIVLADEPTASLDEASSRASFELLRQRALAGSAVVMITHDLEAAARADRTIVVARGRVLVDSVGADKSSLERWITSPADSHPHVLPASL